MIATLDKFDLNSIRKYLTELIQHINSKSENDISMVFIIAGHKDKEIDYMIPKGTEIVAARMLIMGIDKLTKENPEIGIRIQEIKL